MLTNSDYKYFKKARMTATFSDYKKQSIGCVAVYQGHIIGVGYNTTKTHPLQRYYNQYRHSWDKNEIPPSLHAEINCLNSIRNLDINFSKVKLYIYRIRHDQDCGLSRPCPSCMAAIKDFGIRDVYYTTNDGFGYERLKNNRIGGRLCYVL